MRCAANDSLEAMSEAATGSRTCEKSIKTIKSGRFRCVSEAFRVDLASKTLTFRLRSGFVDPCEARLRLRTAPLGIVLQP